MTDHGPGIEHRRDALNAALADRLEQWLGSIIGGGPARPPKVWAAGHVKDGGMGSSLQVVLQGPRRGQWYHHAAEVGGDPLGLIAHAKYLSMKDAWAMAVEIVGGAVPELTEADRRRREDDRRKAEAAERARRQSIEQAARRILFREARDGLLDTPAELYLQRRGINLRKLGRPLRSLRFHPALRHSGLNRELPAIVGGIVGRDGKTVAIHRTWLTRRRDADGAWWWDRVRENIEGVDGKLTLGAYKDVGGCIRLWAGERVDPETGEIRKGHKWSEAPEGSDITLVEGIENGLTLAQAKPDRRIAVCVAVAGLANVWLPPAFTTVTLCGDNDAENPAAQAAFLRAVVAHQEAGRAVRDVRPPPRFKDYNDMLLRKQRAA